MYQRINYGENFGLTLNASGTIGAAFEAVSYGVPGIAANLEARLDVQHSSDFLAMDWAAAKYFTKALAIDVLKAGLPPEVAILNLNVPSGATFKTPMGGRRFKAARTILNLRSRSARTGVRAHRLKTIVEIDRSKLEPTSDIQATVYDQVVSVTPLSWSMTAGTDWEPPNLAHDVSDVLGSAER